MNTASRTYRLRLFPKIIALLAVLTAPGSVRAQADSGAAFPEFQWEPIGKADWNPDLSWVDGPPDAVMLFEKAIDDDRLLYWRTLQKREYGRTRILSNEGRRQAAIEFKYFPDFDNLIELKTRTTLRDGRVFERERDDILRTSSEAINEGDNVGSLIRLTFPHADSNCIVEYCLGISQKFGNRVPTYIDRPVQKDIPLLLGEYTWYQADSKGPEDNYVDLGAAYNLWSGANKEVIASAYAVPIERGMEDVVSKVPAWRSEPMSLPEDATRLQIWRYYSKETPRSVIRRIAESYREPEPDRYKFGKKDRKEIAAAADRFRPLGVGVEAVRAVYEWLQDSIANTNYLTSPPDWLTDSKGRKTKKFEDNGHLRDALKHRSGSWQDIDCLFYRILQELGAKALPVLVAGRDERLFNERAGFFQFTRFIAGVRYADGTTGFYAPGEYLLPFGELHWSVEDTDALMADGNPVHVWYTPPEGNVVARTLALDMTRQVPAGTLVERHGGHKGRMCYVLAARGGFDHLNEYLLDSLSLILPGVVGTVDTVVMDQPRSATTVTRFSLEFPSARSGLTDEFAIAPLLFAPDTGNVFTSPARQGEVAFRYAFRAVDTVQVSLARDKRVVTLPADTSVSTEAGQLNLSFAVTDGGLQVVREFVVNRPRIAVEEYDAVRTLFTARRELARLPVILTKSE